MKRFTVAALAALSAAVVSFCQTPGMAPATVDLPSLPRTVTEPRVGIRSSIDLTLAETIERVLANDPELTISRIALTQSSYSIKAALGFFDPVLSLDGYKSRSVTPIASLIGGSESGRLTSKEVKVTPELSGYSPWLGSTYRLSFSDSRQTGDSTFNILNPQYPASVTLDFKQPLWRGLRLDAGRHSLRVARKNRQLSEEQLRQRVIERVTLAVQYYWELYFASQNLDVQSEAVRLSVEQYESNRRQAEQGVLAPISVTEAQTQVATYRQAEAAARQALTVAENNLKQLVSGDRRDTVWSAALLPRTRPDTKVSPPPVEEAVRQALAARPELSINSVNLAVNELDKMYRLDEARPKIDAYTTLAATGLAGTQQAVSPIFGSLGSGTLPAILIGANAQSLANIWAGNFPTVKVGVQFSLPLRNRTAEANLATAAAEGRRLQVLRKQLEMAVEADVRNALEQLSAAQTRYEAAMVARRSAEGQYASEKRQFAAGTSTVFLVFQRQTSFISARSSEERTLADLGQAVANLDRAMARSIEAHQIRITP